MSPIEFRAPWSKTLSTATVFSMVMIGAVLVGAIVFRTRMPLLASLAMIVVPVLVVLVTAPFMVRGYVLTTEEILVKRAGWTVDDGTPVTEDYKEGNNKFTGKIHKVTIDLKDIKAAERQDEEKARMDVAHKKALAD